MLKNSTTSIELAAIWYIQVSGAPTPDKGTSAQLIDEEDMNYNNREMDAIWIV